MRETEELVRLDREIERLLRRRLELVAGPESGSTGYDQCRRAMEAARCPVSQPRVVYQGVARSVQRDGRPHLLWEGGPLSGAGPL